MSESLRERRIRARESRSTASIKARSKMLLPSPIRRSATAASAPLFAPAMVDTHA
jgi:hypothetical protein